MVRGRVMSADRRYPSQDADRFQLRLPAGLRECIREAAEHNDRSMNGELVHVLSQHYGLAEITETPASASEVVELLREIRDDLRWAINSAAQRGQA